MDIKEAVKVCMEVSDKIHGRDKEDNHCAQRKGPQEKEEHDRHKGS